MTCVFPQTQFHLGQCLHCSSFCDFCLPYWVRVWTVRPFVTSVFLQTQFQLGQCLDCEPGGCSELGLYADQHKARGPRYLNTQASSPFCGEYTTTHTDPQYLSFKPNSLCDCRWSYQGETQSVKSQLKVLSSVHGSRHCI